MNLHLPGRDPVRATLTGAALILLAFLGGWWQASTGVFTPLDRAVQAAVAPIQFDALTVVMIVITHFGDEAGLTLVAGLLYWAGRRSECALLLLLLLFAGTGANDHMKNWFALARPTAAETAQLAPQPPAGYGYPSGHTLTGVFLAWLVYHLVGRRLWLCALLAPLMALTRVYLGVHYFSDTVGGALHGLGWLFLAGAAVHVFQLLPPGVRADARAGRRAFLGGGAAAAVLYVFLDPAHQAAVRFGPLLFGAGLGAACVPLGWRARSPARFVVMGAVGMLLVGAVRIGLGALLPPVDLAHAVRYLLVGLVLAVSPVLMVALGLAEYVPAADAAGPAGPATRAGASSPSSEPAPARSYRPPH